MSGTMHISSCWSTLNFSLCCQGISNIFKHYLNFKNMYLQFGQTKMIWNEYPVTICLWFDLAEQMVTQSQTKRKHAVLLLTTVYEVDCC